MQETIIQIRLVTRNTDETKEVEGQTTIMTPQLEKEIHKKFKSFFGIPESDEAASASLKQLKKDFEVECLNFKYIGGFMALENYGNLKFTTEEITKTKKE